MNHTVDFHYFTDEMQRSCSDTFRNSQTLAGLRQQLRDGIVNPLDDDRLILDVIEVAIRPDRRRGTRRRLVYYTLDHRRLKCMKDEGCSQIRVHVVISKNRILDNFVNNPRKKT